MSKGGSHDPQVVADGCDRSSHARPLDRHWDCPGLRFLRRRIRSRFPWRVRSRLLRRVRWFLSGLLPLWLFPVLLLLLLIACSLRPETAQERAARRQQRLGNCRQRWVAGAPDGSGRAWRYGGCGCGLAYSIKAPFAAPGDPEIEEVSACARHSSADMEIGELGEAGFDLSVTGFDEFELVELFAER